MNDTGLLKNFYRYFQALIIIPISFEILFLIYEICLVKDNFSSIINALHKSASDVLKFTKPYKGTQKKIIP